MVHNSAQEISKVVPQADEKIVCSICGKPLAHATADGIGHTCRSHQGKVGKYYQESQKNLAEDKSFISLVALCDYAEKALLKSRYWTVKQTGGDAGVRKPADPRLQVYVIGGRKYVKITAKEALKEISG